MQLRALKQTKKFGCMFRLSALVTMYIFIVLCNKIHMKATVSRAYTFEDYLFCALNKT